MRELTNREKALARALGHSDMAVRVHDEGDQSVMVSNVTGLGALEILMLADFPEILRLYWIEGMGRFAVRYINENRKEG